MATISKRRLIILAVAFVTAPVWGQSAIHWTSYKMADGLSEPVLDSISVTPQGRVIASRFNAPLASELDGYSVSNFPAPAGNLGRICVSPGGQRWALVARGLMEYKNETWLLHPVPEISAAVHPGSLHAGSLPTFLPVRQGSVLFLLPEGLMELSAEIPDAPRTILLKPAAATGIGDFTGMAVSPDEGLWISGTHGLAKAGELARNLEPKTTWHEYLPPESLQLGDFNQVMPDHGGGVTLLAESSASRQQWVVAFDGHTWAALPSGPRKFFCVWREPDQSFWAATTNALFQWSPAGTNWVEHEEISAGLISDVAMEPGGAFWLATSDGLFRGSLPLWGKPEPVVDLDLPVECMTVDSQGWLYFIAGNKLHLLRDEVHREYPLPQADQNSQFAQTLFPLRDGSLLVGRGGALLQFKPPDALLKPLPAQNQAQPAKPLGLLPDGSVCLYYGGGQAGFNDFDGTQFHPLPNPPPVQDDEALALLFSNGNGDLWMGGGSSVFWRHDDKWERFASSDHSTPAAVVGFAEMPDGKIGCATPDELWEFDGKNWSLLQTRFNHINCLMQGRQGEVWLASNSGLFRFCHGIWMENGAEEGLPNGPVTALCEDPQGQTWAANARGLTVFRPQADTSPPRTYVHWLGGNDRRLSEGDTLNLLFDGEDKWKITPRERLLYSYQLDQQQWSDFQTLTMLTLPAPGAGPHTVHVRSMDRDGNVDPIWAMIDFTVITPWFRETRLWIILLLGAAAAFFFAAVALNRHRQLLRSHAAVEQKVAERTRELEIATRELLHSQKMNALGTLAAGIAHDFNNILSIIKGSAQIIEDNTDQPEKIRTRVDRIKTVVQQGAEIVDAMLGFGRGSDAGAQPCDINSVVADTIKLLGDRFLREVEVKFERAGELPEVSTSREFIQQILLNFIFNAAEAMSQRKKISLTTRLAEKLPPDIFLPPAAAASFVLVSVQDQGAGMAPEIQARIFEPFFTTKAMSTKRGTGLGLSMVYELAKKMGAGLSVQSVVGEGSVFTLILPVQGVPAAEKRTRLPIETLHT
jgi:signal transduction histidine kinase